ncbi:nucleoside monophosphate kinase [Planctomycetes bacterium CA13]|uniref:nucleoside monophosphate kinase n=1 Tax=Novipirellula herctigrandis TaxID=2527986 RepID=UPI0011B7FE66
MNRSSTNLTEKKQSRTDLEVKDAQLIFNSVLKDLEAEYGRNQLRFPKELILLGGAPGAGKGTNTDYIRKVRDITSKPIVVSALLDSPEAKAIKARGGMVGDREVIGILFRELLKPEHQAGAILDGFPRTKVQVECLKMLNDEMKSLRREHAGSPEQVHFKQPCFHIMVLFVDEAESISRQMTRGRQVIAHNEEVKRTGTGTLWEERPTDFNEDLARNRYRVFKEHTYDALVSLKQIFHYHFINAQAPMEVVKDNILRELEYQSSLELDPHTFHSVSRIPLASDILLHARRDLVSRLDAYAMNHSDLFEQVIELIESKMMPIVIRHAISGYCSINTESELFGNPLSLKMLIDVFSERGFHASIDLQRDQIPVRFNLKTGEVVCSEKKVYRIAIRFRGSEIRRG